MPKAENENFLLDELGLIPFVQRFPWIGGDMQTLRDTFVDEKLFLIDTETVQIAVPSKRRFDSDQEYLIAFINRPLKTSHIKGLVLMVHGLGGSSRRRGLRRMAASLLDSGFAVMRLNLRGAAPGREFASGTYSANCNSDVLPAIEKARKIAHSLSIKEKVNVPLFGVGISLGGTILLNACFAQNYSYLRLPLFDGLVCISSPLDLISSSISIERSRNRFYQKWLLNRLIQQTLNDPFGITDGERELLLGKNRKNGPIISSIRGFDSAITSPRWGFANVDDYYRRASPIQALSLNISKNIQKIFLLHSLDDPWVPSEPTERLSKSFSSKDLGSIEILITSNGGHNGFHGLDGCWGDEVVKCWLLNASTRYS